MHDRLPTHFNLDTMYALRLRNLYHTFHDAGVTVQGKRCISVLARKAKAYATTPGMFRELAGRAGMSSIEGETLFKGPRLCGI